MCLVSVEIASFDCRIEPCLCRTTRALFKESSTFRRGSFAKDIWFFEDHLHIATCKTIHGDHLSNIHTTDVNNILGNIFFDNIKHVVFPSKRGSSKRLYIRDIIINKQETVLPTSCIHANVQLFENVCMSLGCMFERRMKIWHLIIP